ncbi:MAG TPA: ABC transporter permease [Thermoanaerobaculia bacterium]|nr:ABC transporter permease [Thermoanaerobaculia bacterium]
MTHLLQDLRYGLRGLARSPGFTAAAVLTLALGIGANTAMFSLVDAVLLRPLPYPHPERLVRVRAVNPEKGQDANLNPLDFADYRRQARSFKDLAAMATPTFSLTGGGEPERVRGALVSSNFFRAFGARPALGRDFQPRDEQPDAEPVVILSKRLWQRRYNSDPGILGKTIVLDDAPVTVVAVLESGFRAPGASEADLPEVWRPFQVKENMGRGGHWLPVFGRLADGVTIRQAQAEMDALARSLEKEHPGSNQGWATSLEDLEESIVGNTRGPLVLLLASVGLVLLIACVNVANLLLARAGSREHEVAVRATLGASASRLLRQLLTESLLLAGLGAAAGLLLAFFATRLLSRLDPEILPRAGEVAMDGRVLAFTLGISGLAAVVFGLVPALRTARGAVLRQGTRTTPGRRLPAALVIAELALALVLLIGAGLLLKSFWRLLRVDPGFRAENLLTATVDLPVSRYGEPHQISRSIKTFSRGRPRCRGSSARPASTSPL